MKYIATPVSGWFEERGGIHLVRRWSIWQHQLGLYPTDNSHGHWSFLETWLSSTGWLEIRNTRVPVAPVLSASATDTKKNFKDVTYNRYPPRGNTPHRTIWSNYSNQQYSSITCKLEITVYISISTVFSTAQLGCLLSFFPFSRPVAASTVLSSTGYQRTRVWSIICSHEVKNMCPGWNSRVLLCGRVRERYTSHWLTAWS